MKLKNPPLLEIVAEVRWGKPTLLLPDGGTLIFGAPETQAAKAQHPFGSIEELFVRFASKLATSGYTRVERLVPHGAPITPHQSVYRYLRQESDGAKCNAVIHLGNGVFSVNATPPYSSWSDFEPIIKEALTHLFELPGMAETPVTSTTLRYIDGFDSKFTEGRNAFEFAKSSLGAEIKLPDDLIAMSNKPDRIKTNLKLNIPVEIGDMQIVLSDAVFNGTRGVVLDTTIKSHVGVENPTPEKIMATLNQSQELAAASFGSLTRSLMDAMGVVNE